MTSHKHSYLDHNGKDRPSGAEATELVADGQIQPGRRKPARHPRRCSSVVVATTTPPQPLSPPL
ncbi:Os03g0349800 [Oryza sativa Japonica Group]|uniref:Os03g0349800 protein n=1 Tax=Oryza sativa subsp. japonica TaxID=39947 RepID=Q0DRW3_ORYSJ|nr:Os03g0349800 [Oryza sativa Japonica Group]|eukprot:NP_001050111.1 Os03g0349800 [Oryza sativa Japonica Group]